jgi:hypothetical protein
MTDLTGVRSRDRANRNALLDRFLFDPPLQSPERPRMQSAIHERAVINGISQRPQVLQHDARIVHTVRVLDSSSTRRLDDIV